jgi:RimJ/RimL family protein N-acetyltransferase
MKLLSAYDHPDAVDLLWHLLREREAYQSISHKRMPTPAEHKAFITRRPYPQWYLIDCGDLVGATYLTDRREVGIAILRKFRGSAYGRTALLELLRLHPGPMLANINPANRSSLDMFRDLGFAHVQNTLALST